MGRMFIDRPVFAIVISLFLVLTGALTALQLPVAQYPQIALPTVRVSAIYPGASADVVEEAVTTPLEPADQWRHGHALCELDECQRRLVEDYRDICAGPGSRPRRC